MAAWAAAERSRGGLLVIHENRGLNDHIRSVAGRLAASGYSALALDLLSEEGGTGSFPGEAEVGAALAAAPPERFDEDMQAALTELARRCTGKRRGLAAIGFCFGGGMVWTTARDRRAAARSSRAVLRAVSRGRGSARFEGCRARRLRRARHARERHARRSAGCARGSAAEARDPHVHRAPTTPSSTRRARASMLRPHEEAYRRVLDWFDRFVADDD